MRTQVYFNSHKKKYSVRRGGIVQSHVSCALIHNPRFVVSEAGRQRALREGRKNVHAFVVATTSDDIVPLPDPHRSSDLLLFRLGWTQNVWYRHDDPSGSFLTGDASRGQLPEAPEPIHSARWAYLWINDGYPFILVRPTQHTPTLHE